MFQFDENLAKSAGSSQYITEGGAYVVQITKAIYGVSSAKKTKYLQLSVKAKGGQVANYLSIYYQSANGEYLKGGAGQISAMIGLIGLQSLSEATRSTPNGNEQYAPELEGKFVGLFLQKVNGFKPDGTPKSNFEIAASFDPRTKQTYGERCEGKQASIIDYKINSYSDKQEKPQQQSNQAGAGYANQPQNFDSFDDDIPF